MNISGFLKLTLLDYPNKTACMIFTSGCNFNCLYCHNSSLIAPNKSLINESEIFDYLKKRKGIIDGIVISGGEPTLQKDLIPFIEKIKELGFLVKLDTNGTNPSILKKLLDQNLVDYIAMDIKHAFSKYNNIIRRNIDISKIKESIDILKNSTIDYEFRTTIVKDYFELDDILEITNYIGKDVKYFLQNFRDSEGVVNKTLKPFSKEELLKWQEILKKDFPNLVIREL